MTAPVWLTAPAAAARAGISESAWRSYASRRHPRANPVPACDRRNPDTGVQEWLPATVDAWMSRRAGRGSRTDLRPS